VIEASRTVSHDPLTRFRSRLPRSVDGHLNRPCVGRHLGWRRRHGNGDAEALACDSKRLHRRLQNRLQSIVGMRRSRSFERRVVRSLSRPAEISERSLSFARLSSPSVRRICPSPRPKRRPISRDIPFLPPPLHPRCPVGRDRQPSPFYNSQPRGRVRVSIRS